MFKPHVLIWNYQSLNIVATIGLGVYKASICSLSFSPDVSLQISPVSFLKLKIFFFEKFKQGSKLMVLDEGDRHSFSVWKWSENKQIASTQVGFSTISFSKFQVEKKVLSRKKRIIFDAIVSLKPNRMMKFSEKKNPNLLRKHHRNIVRPPPKSNPKF